MAFIAGHAGRTSVDGLRWGVEPICRVLTEHGVPIAPSTYYDAINQQLVSEAELREEKLMLAIARVHHHNYSVYGTRKVWLALNRDGVPVARCTVERLMKVLGLHGARRGRTMRTTRQDPAATRPADLVERNFNPSRPDALWVADFSYVPTWAGFVYVAFVIDAFSRRILGWRAASSMRTELVLDALEMAIWTRARAGVADLTGLVAAGRSIRSNRTREAGCGNGHRGRSDSLPKPGAEDVLGGGPRGFMHPGRVDSPAQWWPPPCVPRQVR